MSSPLNICQPASKAKHMDHCHSNSNGSSSSVYEPKPTPDLHYAPTCLATRSASHQLSETSETTMLSRLYDSDAYDNASSITLQDEFPWHQVDVNKCTQRIPSTVVPALLQGITNVSPSRSSLDGGENGSREVDEYLSDLGDVVPRYSAAQKGKWKAQTDGDTVHDSRWIRSPSPELHFDSIYNSVEDWVIHTRPVLQGYANRQISLPLGRRLEVSIDEPPTFILGAIQLLVNRDQGGCGDRSRRLGPQLIENFVDIDRWVKEYFRSRHGTQLVDSDVPALLTIVMNNFYEGQVQLIDRLVEFALEGMRFCGRASLGIEDFAFGFDFKMSQDLPFYVETSSQIRKPLPIRAVEVQPASEPVTTNSGRQVKPTERARAASEQEQANASERRNKGKNASQAKDKRAPKRSTQPARPKKNLVQPSSRRTDQETPESSQLEPHTTAPASPKATSEHIKHRPVRPSNLGLPPILPDSSSTSGTALSQADDSSKSQLGTSAENPKTSGSLGSKPTTGQSPRPKIILPPPISTIPAMSGSGSISSATKDRTPHTNPSENTNKWCGASRSGGTRPRGPRNRYGRGHGCERGSTSLASSAEIPEATRDDAKTLPATHSVDASCAKTSTAVGPLVTSLTLVNAPRNAAGRVTRARLCGSDNSIGTRDNSPTSRCPRTGQPLVAQTDPGHPHGKKRKLDDCED